MPGPGTQTRLLRAAAVGATLRRWSSAVEAVHGLGFVQYDPLRKPARAQDLILAARVPGYRAGGLDAGYPDSGLEEDDLHVYGAMTGEVRSLLHPRPGAGAGEREYRPTGQAAEVLAAVRELGAAHPREIASRFGSGSTVNDWGGRSTQTTRVLEELHYYGRLRVHSRTDGTKVYQACDPMGSGLPAQQRLVRLIGLLARLLAPVPETGLNAAVRQLRANAGRFGDPRKAVAELLRNGELRREVHDGVGYLWPEDLVMPAEVAVPRRVRFLAPFDPLVWDRGRFEQLWGWPYRLEAYTPARLRRFGHYAMPMLWGHDIPGWVTCTPRDGQLDVQPGFARTPPRGTAFAVAFEAEVARLRRVAGPPRR